METALKIIDDYSRALVWMVSGVPDHLWKFYVDAAPPEMRDTLHTARGYVLKARSSNDGEANADRT
jgi:hypothetical protein